MASLLRALLLVVICESLTLPVVWADGFEVRGYQQGMTKIEVERIATSRNQTIKIGERGWSIYTDPERPTWVNFCNGELYRFSWLFDGGGLMQFLKIIDDYVQKQNYNNFQSRISVRVGYDGQERGTLSHYLMRDGERYYIEINLFANDTHDITNGQITYEEWGEHMDCVE